MTAKRLSRQPLGGQTTNIGKKVKLMTLPTTIKVWRYMSFAKLTDMLQHKQLWFTNVECLEDKWEVMPHPKQMNMMINNMPSTLSVEVSSELILSTIKSIRKMVFINCWTASDYESHALWRIYCPSNEGVCIQTTLDRLRKSIKYPILEVSYEIPKTDNVIKDVLELVTQKRPIFAYEQEVRIVIVNEFIDPENNSRKTIGVHVDWDPELYIENIWVHPDASFWFMKTVMETVRQLAPRLSTDGNPNVWWSTINSSPPIK
jgi:hypothetical protein